MPVKLAGTWSLLAWRRIAEDGTVTFPLGEDASGVLVYTTNGRMSVTLTAADRPALPTSDPLSGDPLKRAAAYSTCLAYAGTYRQDGDTVIHTVDVSLYPNWAGEAQTRFVSLDGSTLTLRTPPSQGASGTVVNELSFTREE